MRNSECLHLFKMEMHNYMEKELPILDIPEKFVIGTGIPEEILNLYKNYPCHLKALVVVLCRGGMLHGTVNLHETTVKKNDFIVLSPGSVLQLHKAEQNPILFVGVFSSEFLSSIKLPKNLIEFLFRIKSSPTIPAPENYAEAYETLCKGLIKLNEIDSDCDSEIIKTILTGLLLRIKSFYKEQDRHTSEKSENKTQAIVREFGELVIQHYTHERNIAFYARKLGITATHLSNTIKAATGKTVITIIAEMVINDAKAQLKSTTIPINQIADSLNFANVSFFGKYFKRYVGMSPVSYRNQ